jgi:hypothetical protein
VQLSIKSRFTPEKTSIKMQKSLRVANDGNLKQETEQEKV